MIARRLVLVAAACGAFAPARAYAQSVEIQWFTDAKTAYDGANYAEAVRRFEPLLDGGARALTSEILLQEARKYYGASLVLVGRTDDAEHVFEVMLQQNSRETMSAALFPTNVLDVYNGVRRRLEDDLARQEEAVQRAEALAREREAERIRADVLSRAVLYETSIERRPLWTGLLPLGIAQFQNNQATKGALFLTGEGLLLAVNMTSFLLSYSMNGADNAPVNRALRDGFFVSNLISTGALVVLLGLGAWDGIANLETKRVVRRRLSPEEVREAIEGELVEGAAREAREP